jgi:heme oxygenase
VCRFGAKALGFPGAADALEARRSRLACDLNDLHVSPLPPFTFPEGVLYPGPFAIGCLYTASGSALGGVVIARQIEGLMADGRGRSFFALEPGARKVWSEFCAALEHYGRREDRLDMMVEGAQAAFALFRVCLDADAA